MKTCVHPWGLLLSIGVVLALARPGAAQDDTSDSIRLTTSAKQVSGKITAVTATEVSIQVKVVGLKTIPANEIEYINFGEAPEGIKDVRIEMAKGNYESADRRLKKIDRAKADNENVKAELDYLQAVVASRQAQGGKGTLLEAATLWLNFIKAHPNSYAYYPANEMLGDLLVALGKYPQAEKYYAELAKAPWPNFKMRASIAAGRAQLAQNKFLEAYKMFDAALNLSQAGAQGTEPQILSATLGKAEALALGGKIPEGLKIAEDVLAKASADDSDLNARVYNTLGFCYTKANRDKDALMAYLHVDLLYPTLPDAHAEALSNLANLWEKLGRPDRGSQARTALQTKYPNSRWSPKTPNTRTLEAGGRPS